MVLGGSADSVTVGCLDCPSWRDCVQDSRWAYGDSESCGAAGLAGLRNNRAHHTAARSENLRRNLPSFRVLRLLFTIGVALIALAYAVYLINPIEIAINVRMSFKNGSFLFGLWRKPPVQIYVQVYLFNITNPREFLKGQEKLRVEELGPFVYREELENTNVIFNPNDTVTYIPRRQVVAVPEMSIGDPKEMTVIAPNLALLGLASSLHNSSIFTNLAFATLSSYLNTQPFLHLSVHDYLWGFDEPLVHLASKIFPKWIHFPRFGLLDRMFDEGDNVVTMNIYGDGDTGAPSADLLPPGTDKYARRAFAIDSWNGSPGLAHWGFGATEDSNNSWVASPETSSGTRCNTIRGATEGILFPRNMKKDMRFSVYRKAFCRTLPLQFEREAPTEGDVPAFWYTLRDDIFETADSNPDNACYCRPEVAPCLPRGLSDLTPCYYDIPAAVSLPHFYKGDESLLRAVDGLNPEQSLHATTLAIQPRIGVPLVANIRVQTNLVIHKTKGNPRVAPFNNLTLPIFWVDLTVRGLPDSLTSLLDLMLVVAPAIQTTAIAGLSVVGALLLLSACVGVCCTAGMLHASRRTPAAAAALPALPAARRAPRAPAWNGKYSQVKIIAAVKPEHLVSLSLGREDAAGSGKGRA